MVVINSHIKRVIFTQMVIYDHFPQIFFGAMGGK